MENMTGIEDVKINFDNIQDKILIGPQAEVLEKLDRFNHVWNTDLSVTKTFRWSPGIYDKMKALLTEYFLGWNTRSNSMYTLFNKLETNAYRKRSIGMQIKAIDEILCRNRQDGMIFQENPEEIKEYLNMFINSLCSFGYSDGRMAMSVVVDQNMIEGFNSGNYRDVCLNILIDIFPTNMHTSVWDSDLNAPRDIGDIYMPFTIKIDINVSFIKWFNKFIVAHQNNKDITRVGGINANHQDRGFMHGNIDREHNIGSSIIHPYISANGNRNGVCWGNLQEDLCKYLFNLNLTMFTDTLYRWATTFVVHKSHPFNQINRTFYGWPKGISKDDMMILQGKTDAENCSYVSVLNDYIEYPDDYSISMQDENYCDTSGCQLRESCYVYKRVVDGDNSKAPKTHRLEANQRSSPWPSWMAQDEDGTWRDTRTQLSSDMQVESDMVSNDQPISDRFPFDPEAIARMAGETIAERFVNDSDRIQEWVEENAQDLIQSAPMSEEEIEQAREQAQTDPDTADEDTPF